MSILYVTHKCDCCDKKGTSSPGSVPLHWRKSSYFDKIGVEQPITVCERCSYLLQKARNNSQDAFFETFLGIAPGDEVRILVDGFRGKYKGCRGVVMQQGDYKDIWIIRVPGSTDSSEEDYYGPYSEDQFERIASK